MANLQVNQIRKHLTDNYIRFVDASDIKATDEDKDIHILSRAYAAYAVVTLGNYEPQDVCACIPNHSSVRAAFWYRYLNILPVPSVYNGSQMNRRQISP